MTEYFKNAKYSVFRFEKLQEYKVEEDEDPVELENWLELVKNKTSEGIEWGRVRLVSEPLTEYTKEELTFFKEKTIKAGAKVLIVRNEAFKDLNIELEDFWLVDDKIVLEMQYTAEGEYLGFKESNKVQEYIKAKNLLISNSVGLEEYLVRVMNR